MLVPTAAALPCACRTGIGAWVVQLVPSKRSFTVAESVPLNPVMAYRLEPATAVAGLRRAVVMGGSLRHPGVQLGDPVGVAVAVAVGVGLPPWQLASQFPALTITFPQSPLWVAAAPT